MTAPSKINLLSSAQTLAEISELDQCLNLFQKLIDSRPDDPDILMNVGTLLLYFGFLTGSRQCFSQAAKLIPNDHRPIVNLAKIARDAGNYAESRRLYSHLLQHFPDNPVIRHNFLISLEYDPDISDQDRLDQARSWGEWALTKAGGIRERPHMRSLEGRALRVGYVFADFCERTVGVLVKDVLAAHNPDRVTVFAYSAGEVHDWVPEQIWSACRFQDVSNLDGATLVARIKKDQIDVLVDLSGHTAGSRLAVFVYCKQIQRFFTDQGISPDRLSLRRMSAHREFLEQYADIDIALDPFPFSGGHTSCEALWMGVPVVTYPSSRVVSRQGLAVLSAIGLPDLAAETAEAYVETAVALSQDTQRLKQLRTGMRSRMKDSMLMDVKGFTGCLEQALRDLYGKVKDGVLP